ncbi:hypothetical protein A2715_02635 [Candidatus Woesebacteria bacterium RIFCSPHIGHO2_01_FULL_39_32]|uniref:Uncharacterized protein n=1 Tax=Candidatus Woesebacteria bacterium RIFCSPLOWO2_01_FULL_39_25 TaxID=1802521 RepID=A0A1F8BK29_9BACT|nr:MAG: hypothetical protein A2124_01250 [Candidatus Woesebacteria bacterium GWB1_37_5]OGM24050.1 MAG: hypothetical protein A2715_02635 [Candidatus Woesebacteria bacterium RIFCSPHIGHO2_01_FULL_39_32]OGM38049.1 MAG: hypothetical protein A3F01_05950 [Candidatus Woesebacteria bacterium RIFCSPHIGHO2_12_FULL_38_11]OGM64393.1 MAG: hypothetical protein A2893_00810 [Candidatus Woesebacteria bacterium RIFCSPLOWO2_01_FULL_39_25]
MKTLWNRWRRISNVLLDREANVILSFLYFLLIGPYAVISKILYDPFNLKSHKESFWFSKSNKNVANLKGLKNQY